MKRGASFMMYSNDALRTSAHPTTLPINALSFIRVYSRFLLLVSFIKKLPKLARPAHQLVSLMYILRGVVSQGYIMRIGTLRNHTVRVMLTD